MKLKKIRHILTLAVLLCTLFYIAPSASAAVSSEEMAQILKELPMKPHSYTYSDNKESVYYSHALLFQDFSTISPDLVKSSMALSVSAYDRESVNSLMKSMGFKPEDNTAVYDRSESGLTVTDCDYAAYTIATAEVKHPLKNADQDDYIIYCVAIQGTPMNLEWLSDFNLGDGVYHEGFRKASEEIYYAVREMCKEDDYPSGRTILWLTGHSRGAACANLLASWFRERENYDVPVVKKNVVAYTFACPAVSKEADPTMPGIYNFNNPGDLVTLVPLPEWGYGRYGQTIELDTSAMGYGNFTSRYAAVTGKTYAGTIDDRDYRAILSEIGKSDNTQLILDLVAWILNGCNRDVLNEIILKNMPDDPQGFLSILEKAVPAAGFAGKVFDLVEFLYTHNDQNDGLRFWASDNYYNYLDATPEEFELFLQNNASIIVRLEDITGIDITSPQDLHSAAVRLETDSNNTLRLQSFIGSAADLICDGEGNIASKVLHAHTESAYAIWINSMFYGYQGWYSNSLVSQISLDERYFSVGAGCFYNCDAIEEIVIPDSVTHVGNNAFSSCDGVTSLTIPADLKYGNAFIGTSGIKTIHYTPGTTGIMPDRPVWSSNSKVNEGYFAPEFQSSGALQEIIFDDGITHIASYLCQVADLERLETLTSVTLPSTLESIGAYAFSYCFNAEFNEWPEGLTTIGEYSFLNCDKLKTHPSTLNAFPEGCFYFCDGLTEINIPNHFTEIGSLAFWSCDNVTALTLPADLQYSDALGIASIKTIRYTPGATGVMPDRPKYSSSVNAGYYAPEYQSQTALQEIIFEDGITHIAAYLMQTNRSDRTSLTSVTLPSTLESVGAWAFSNCNYAVFNEWPEGLTEIGEYSFMDCDKLKTHPSTLTAFPDGCFKNCDGLTEINIPNHFTEIGSQAFRKCICVSSLTLPADLQCSDAFWECWMIRTIHYTPGTTGIMPDRPYYSSGTYNAGYYAPEYQSGSNLQEIIFDDGITHIASYLCQISSYADHDILYNVTLPSTLESVGEQAFYNCYNTTFSDWPQGVTAIGSYAFYSCGNLGNLSFSSDAPAIGDNAFYNVTTTAFYPASNSTWTENVLQNYGGNIAWVPLSCNGGHMEVTVKGTAPICSQPGLTDGTRCSLCGEPLQPQEEIPATGNHTYGTPTFTWDEAFTCTAVFTCQDCGAQNTVTCSVTSTTIPAEGETPARIIYTATALLDDNTYTDIKTINSPEVDHTHTPADQWQHDHTSHWKQCTGCGEKLETAKHTPDAERICTVCTILVPTPPELNWFFEKLEEPDNYLWASGTYVKIMEQYGDYIGNIP